MPTINGYNVVAGANLTNADISNGDLTGVNLTGCNFTNANLTNCNLTGANLTNANLLNATLDNCNIEKTTLTNCTLTGVDLSGVASAKDITPANGDGVTIPGNYYLSRGYLLNTDRTVKPLQQPTTQVYRTNGSNDVYDMITDLSQNYKHSAAYGDY